MLSNCLVKISSKNLRQSRLPKKLILLSLEGPCSNVFNFLLLKRATHHWKLKATKSPTYENNSNQSVRPTHIFLLINVDNHP